MKSQSDNFRSSAVQDLIKKLLINKIKVIIFEPLINKDFYLETDVVNDFDSFVKKSSLIVTNRMYKELEIAKYKIYTRDLFERD
jgi:UDPglucose 6-dehydrogenase